LKFPALVLTNDPHQVDCERCLRLVHGAIGDGALHAEAIREITAITLDIATKQDLAELKTFIERMLCDLGTHARSKTESRYMNVEQCAAYIGRTPRAVYHLVENGQIPHARPGRRLQFDREKIDRWMARHARRGAWLSG
jgi:excisionase family DNA binding protein